MFHVFIKYRLLAYCPVLLYFHQPLLKSVLSVAIDWLSLEYGFMYRFYAFKNQSNMRLKIFLYAYINVCIKTFKYARIKKV